MLGPGLQVSVGTTVCTSSGTKYPSTLEWVHQWVFIIYCTGFLSHSLWSWSSLCHASWRVGGEERDECSRAETIPKEAGLPKCLEGEGGRYHLARTSEPQFELCWRHPSLSEGLTVFPWFHPLRFQKCLRHVCWGGPQTSRGSKSHLYPQHHCNPLPHLFFLLCRSIFFLFRIIS